MILMRDSDLKSSEKSVLVSSIWAGCCRNKTLSSNEIEVTPVNEQGTLELYCQSHSESIAYLDQEITYCVYELRWKSMNDIPTIPSVTLTITSEHEFIKYSEVDKTVIFLLRKKKSGADRFPYFFWCQESDKSVYDRFFTTFDICMKKIEKEKLKRNEFEKQKPMDLVEFIKEKKIISILDNREICKKLYPLVPECFQTPAGLKRIMNSSSFRKNVTYFQDMVNNLGINMSSELYCLDQSDMMIDTNAFDSGVKSYICHVEKWAKEKLEEEKGMEEEK